MLGMINSVIIAWILYFGFIVLVAIYSLFRFIAAGFRNEKARRAAKEASCNKLAAIADHASFADINVVIEHKPAEKPVKPDNIGTRRAFEKQRDIILAQISDCEYNLDLAPREKERQRLQALQLRLYGSLAKIENAIYKLDN